MLTIRREQLEAFEPITESAFEQRLVDYLRANHAEAVVRLPGGGESSPGAIPDETFRRMVRGGVSRARAYGMTWESSITAFLVLMLVVAPNFDDHPLIRRVLEDESLEPDARLDALWERTTEENWEAAAGGYDPASWDARTEEG